MTDGIRIRPVGAFAPGAEGHTRRPRRRVAFGFGDAHVGPGEGLVEYLQGMAAGLEADHETGTPYRLSELPQDHPARVFADSLAVPGA